MDARARILALRLMEALRENPGYAQALGIEAGMKGPVEGSMHPHLRAEGLTKL